MSRTIWPPRSLGEDQDLDHTVARRVGEVLLHDLERGNRAEHPGESGNRANASRSGAGPEVRERGQRLRERSAGGDGGDEVAQPVGPGRLHLAERAPSDGGRSTPPGASATPPAGTSATSGVPVTRQTTTKATAPAPSAVEPRTARGVSPTPAWSSHSCRAADLRARSGAGARTRGAPRSTNPASEEAGRRRRGAAARRVTPVGPRPRGCRAGVQPLGRDRSTRLEAPGSAPVHRAGRPSAAADEDRLDREVVAQRGHDGDDLDAPRGGSPRPRCGVSSRPRWTTRSSDSENTLRTTRSRDVLARHQRGVHERVQRLGRAVRVHRAEEPAPGVHRAAELERLRAADLPHHDAVGTHRQDELHEVPQADLAGPVERRRPHLVVRAVRDRHRDLADLLAAADAVARRLGGEQRRGQRRLAGTGLARDRRSGSASASPRRGTPPPTDRASRARTSSVERDVAHRVATERRRELVADRRDRSRQPRAARRGRAPAPSGAWC